VKLLEDSGYQGMRHFDAHAFRTEDENGVWDFAAGCMRTYLILKEKAARWNADPEIRQLRDALRALGGPSAGEPVKFTAEKAKALKEQTLDLKAIREQGFAYERLDQLTIEILLGVR
jgi:xylose isomerase